MLCFIWYIKNWRIVKNVRKVLASSSIFLFFFALVSIRASSCTSVLTELFFLLGGINSGFVDLFLAISNCICCRGKHEILLKHSTNMLQHAALK